MGGGERHQKGPRQQEPTPHREHPVYTATVQTAISMAPCHDTANLQVGGTQGGWHPRRAWLELGSRFLIEFTKHTGGLDTGQGPELLR